MAHARRVVLRRSRGMEKIFGVADYYEQAVARPDARPADFFALGVARTMLKDYEAAVKAFNRALETTPDFTMALMGRAFARSRIPENRLCRARSRRLRQRPSPQSAADLRLVQQGETSPTVPRTTHRRSPATAMPSRSIPRSERHTTTADSPICGWGTAGRPSADLSKAGELGVVPSPQPAQTNEISPGADTCQLRVGWPVNSAHNAISDRNLAVRRFFINFAAPFGAPCGSAAGRRQASV